MLPCYTFCAHIAAKTCPSKHFDDGGLISMTGTLHDSHRLSVKTWTEEESDRADSILS
ncbi:hypothetical protein ATANTOWER_010792, partial [Ataeniobius toweri]|nr:hypothetical protein [Ataeniobius toweri]